MNTVIQHWVMVILSIVLVISSLNLNYTTKIPTITIEVDNRWESEYLEILLLIAKRFGATRSWHTLLLLCRLAIPITFPTSKV